MIPYFYFHMIQLGPFMIHTWSIIVVLGFMVGLFVASRRARKFQLDADMVWNWGFWIVIAAFIGARLFYVFFSDWDYFRSNPIDIFKLWQGGMASFGGIIGAVIASVVYAKIKKLDFVKYADLFMYAFPLGWGIGRIGCFINHLHPGRLSTLPIAVAFPDGARLDMGLLESLALFALFGVVVLLSRKPRPDGFYLALVMVSYGTIRFLLDFLRASDLPMSNNRYAGLTLPQYGSILLILGGVYLWHRFKQSNHANRQLNEVNYNQ